MKQCGRRKMKQQLLDLVEHTVFACGVEHVRICANGLAHIHANTSDKQVVVYGKCNTPPTKCYGITDKGELHALLSNPSLSLVKQENNLLTFKNATTGNSIVYSFISEQRIAELVTYSIPKAKFDFDAVATLSNTFVEKLKQQAKIGKASDDICPQHIIAKSNISFQFGDWSTVVQGNVFLPANYPYVGEWMWDINVLIRILSQTGEYKLGISSKGYMCIDCVTEYAKYKYILPALAK